MSTSKRRANAHAHKSDPEIIEKRVTGRRVAYDAMLLVKQIEIEKKPPPIPTNRFNIPEVTAYKEKLFKTVDACPKGGAFIIPTVLKLPTQRYLKDNYEGNFKFKYVTIPDNTKMTRVYKIDKEE